MEIEILYQDDSLVLVNKPAGWFVHRSGLDYREQVNVVTTLKNQIGRRVFPAHRLDRKTSGVLLFALSAEVAANIQEQFANRDMKKTYQALVRGFIPAEGRIDYALRNDSGKVQEAITEYRRLQTYELTVPFGQHSTSRYSLVELKPKTGRMHQIRKHLAHINYPIIGDRPHGCNKQNKLFKEKWGSMRMYLHATSLEFEHPVANRKIKIESPLPNDFEQLFDEWGSLML